MSLLVEVRKQPRIVNGELVAVGEPCRLPNSLAVALENKGLVAWPSEKVAIKAGKEKAAAAKKAKEKAEKEKVDKK